MPVLGRLVNSKTPSVESEAPSPSIQDQFIILCHPTFTKSVLRLIYGAIVAETTAATIASCKKNQSIKCQDVTVSWLNWPFPQPMAGGETGWRSVRVRHNYFGNYGRQGVVYYCEPIGKWPRRIEWCRYWWCHVTRWRHSSDVNGRGSARTRPRQCKAVLYSTDSSAWFVLSECDIK